MDTFDQLVVKSLPMLRSFALGMTKQRSSAEDLAQDTVVRALLNRDKFEIGTNFEAWIYTILRNVWFSRRRKHNHEVQGDMEGLIFLNQSDGLDVEEAFDARRAYDKLKNIPRVHREALVRFGNGDSYEMIARETGAAEGTVKSRIFRGRALLAAEMEAPVKSPPAPREKRKVSAPGLTPRGRAVIIQSNKDRWRKPGEREAHVARLKSMWADPVRSAHIKAKIAETKRRKKEAREALLTTPIISIISDSQPGGADIKVDVNVSVGFRQSRLSPDQDQVIG